MIIVMRHGASDPEIDHVIKAIEERGLRAHVSRGVERTIIGAIGDEAVVREIPFAAFGGVESATPIVQPYKLASRQLHPETLQIQMGPVTLGGEEIVVMGGPCSVEPGDTMMRVAKAVKEAGGAMLRGGAFKPRTSPYDFQGLGEEGLKLLREAGDAHDMPIVTEVMDPRDVELVDRYADMLQIGARNMQNYTLLKEVGNTRTPVLLKRGMSATVKEWLMCAEYILAQGNPHVALCARGIRTFETFTRNTLDIGGVAVAKYESHLPVVVDPSHAAGHYRWVTPLARAGVAAGADALMVEVHTAPEHAVSDGAQTLNIEKFTTLMKQVREVAKVVGRR